MSKQRIPSVSLTIWLLKENITDVPLILPRFNELPCIPVHSGGNLIGELYTKQIPNHPPTWIDFFEERDTLQLSTSTASGVLLVPRGDRYFAVTFGHGHALINPDVREERFGLIVTLNSVDSKTLRSIDIKSFDTIGTNVRVQANRRDGGRPASTISPRSSSARSRRCTTPG